MQHGLTMQRNHDEAASLPSRAAAHQHPVAQPAADSAARLRLGTVGAALIGFVLGAVVWHFVGFWGFVREVVVKGPPVAPAVVAQSGPNCTELVLDRADRSVRLVSCQDDAVELAEASVTAKGDFMLAAQDTPKRWTVTVQEEPDYVIMPATALLLQPRQDDATAPTEPTR